ncbi:hypothetical protein IEK_05201 [Bacillus toyonensis]|uniref:hypothetical protein n=1 Tax=Bacillus toyonensis TaxID=155322 RepID=UPI00027BF19F|nr:hypothetical protein [Bacillus toyonensis]EJV43862.1 hypothetical protein IEK_05201 [Bacillus toyonensis]PHD77919.1 hypothetical protein COF50_30150 [Bacillus toyonensis]
MKVVVPIKKIVSDEDFTLNNVEFIANDNIEEYLRGLKVRGDYPLTRNTMLPSLVGFDFDWYYGGMLAIYEIPITDEQEIFLSHERLITFIRNITEKVNRTLDLIRVFLCNVTDQEKLPSYPGICSEGFSSILLVNNNNEYIPFVCKIHTLSVVEGLGLYLDDTSSYTEDPLYNILYGDVGTCYVFDIIRQAVKRLNQSMYIPDPNSRFVYLMSTLEVICSPEYIGFSEVRKIIAAIICSDKDLYLKFGDKLRELSEIHRTNVVHNGKDIFEEQFENMNKNLLLLQSIIVKCIYGLIKSGAKSEEEFFDFIEMKKSKLDVQPNQKLNKAELIHNILESYNGQVIELENDVWVKVLNNLNKSFLKEIMEGKVKIENN